MAYDEELAYRIREVLGREPDLAEKAMFGGLGFMLGGRMAVAAGSKGVLMVVDVQVGVVKSAWDRDRVVGNVARVVERARAQGESTTWQGLLQISKTVRGHRR